MRINLSDVSICLQEFERAKNEIAALGYTVSLHNNCSTKHGIGLLPYIKISKGARGFPFAPDEVEDCYGFYCKECGNEIFEKKPLYKYAEHFETGLEEFLSSYNDSAVRDIIKVLGKNLRELSSSEKVVHCPCCGAELICEDGYFFEFKPSDYGSMIRSSYEMRSGFSIDFNGGVERNFKQMSDKRKEIEKKQCEDKLLLCQKQYNIPSQNIIDFQKVNEIKKNSDKLKEYILNLVTLENNIYSVTRRLEALYHIQLEANRKAKSYFYEFTQRISEAEQHYQECCKKMQQYKSGDFNLKLPKKPTRPTMETPGLFNKKKVLAENQAKEEQYQTDLLVYEKQVGLYEEEKVKLLTEAQNEVDKAKIAVETATAEKNIALQDTSTPALMAVEIVDKEIDDAVSMIKSLYECRNTLYEFNIIFGKYHNIVALSTFYEYLMAGRCTELEGADGAYNIYENELRANLIIEKLDEIKETQYLMYSSLEKINNNLDYLNTTMSTALESIQHMEKNIAHISENTDVIAHNTAVTAYYSKLNAELTNSLGYMAAFK